MQSSKIHLNQFVFIYLENVNVSCPGNLPKAVYKITHKHMKYLKLIKISMKNPEHDNSEQLFNHVEMSSRVRL